MFERSNQGTKRRWQALIRLKNKGNQEIGYLGAISRLLKGEKKDILPKYSNREKNESKTNAHVGGEEEETPDMGIDYSDKTDQEKCAGKIYNSD